MKSVNKISRLLCGAVALLLLFSSAYSFNASAATRPWIGFSEKDNVFCSGCTEERLIALTFDDGPHPKYTDEILDILNEYDVKATFFVIGENAARYPEKLKRIASEGHEIGNHTYSHRHLSELSRAEFLSELSRADTEIFTHTGIHPVLFRPPEGCCTKITVENAVSLGYKIILWTIDPRDWASPPVSEVTGNVLKHAHAGAILLCHDYNCGKRNPTPEALRQFIPRLREMGYEFVTVSELLSIK